MSTLLLPPNPGPFASLKQWREWREELRALGADTPGVDVELQIAEHAIDDLQEEARMLAELHETLDDLKPYS
ncbi:hypothetical protein [Hydrogenophaga sp.]|uniref:hypothetical protein n=1 Tax=Hydrogenophaga sp. TaxID=1904254 RepID=UPI003D2C85D9